ncbi:MAG TPA: cyclic nucleotide-binding domain-containing protein [bacterium]
MGGFRLAGKFVRSYQGGETIFAEGGSGQEMFVIKAGGVDILKRTRGRDELVGTLGPGEVFGEMALVDNLPRSATAVAAEDGTEVVAIDHAHFVYLIGQQPAFALVVLKALSLKLRAQMAAGHLS